MRQKQKYQTLWHPVFAQLILQILLKLLGNVNLMIITILYIYIYIYSERFTTREDDLVSPRVHWWCHLEWWRNVRGLKAKLSGPNPTETNNLSYDHHRSWNSSMRTSNDKISNNKLNFEDDTIQRQFSTNIHTWFYTTARSQNTEINSHLNVTASELSETNKSANLLGSVVSLDQPVKPLIF